MNSSSLDRTLRQVLIVPIIIVLLGAAALYWQIHQANLTVAQIQHADDAVAKSLLLERLIIDEETGLRGYQTTRDPVFLEPYRNAGRQLPAEFERRRNLTLQPGRRQLVNQLQSQHDAWRQGFAEPLIAAIAAGGQASDVELNLVGKRQMDAMRELLKELVTRPQQRSGEEIVQWRRQVRWMTGALVLIAVLIGLIIGIFTRRRLRQVSDAFRQSHDILRVRAEQAFHSEQNLRTTLQSIGDGVITCDAEGRIETMNDVAQQLTGWPMAEAARLPIERIFNIVDQNTRESLENPATEVKRLNRIVHRSSHTILIRQDLSEIFIEDSGAPIRDKHGAIRGVVLVFRDITMALKSRAALLANEKLAVAGRLAASIAHEIHNPLDAVANLLFLMDGNSSPEETSQFLQMARQELDRVTQISRAMLALYRESRAPVPIDVGETLSSTLMLLERRFNSLGVTAQTDLPPTLVVHGFPAELRQVFTNLLTNAAEASSRGGVVQVTARPASGTPDPDHPAPIDHSGVLVTISDDGPGISESTQSNLFKPFFTTKGDKGTGLGLWVSRGIMTRHGGSITLESSTLSEDHGTTVSVFLATNPTINPAGSAS